jgi:signal transduction histidine kinase
MESLSRSTVLSRREPEPSARLTAPLARANFLSEASRILSASLDLKQTLGAIARLAIPVYADYSFVVLKEGERHRSVAVAHVDPLRQAELEVSKESMVAGFPNPNSAVFRVLESGRSILEHIGPDYFDRFNNEPDRRERLRSLNPCSFVMAPLIARNEIKGVIGLVYSDSKRLHSSADLETVEELGRRAGQALDNATLFEEGQDAIRARDEFLSVASHELKTPVTALLSLLELARLNSESHGSTESQMKMLNGALHQTHRLAKLISNLLDVSRITVRRLTLSKSTCDLAELARGVCERLEPEALRAHSTLRCYASSAVLGRWDSLRLEQVLVNLITNAIRYGQQKPIEIRVSVSDDKAVLEVEDWGIGIAPENQSRIFERFERGTPAHSRAGLGLGLYIVKQIVDAHRGKVSLRSEPGRGSLFRVEIPSSA